ncbi:nickel insertion protein [Intestinibacter sp.]|uniref:nickel insertion protein n=1 Tax=Intestinibacter sp. TaxID=1965304 RepID=UPI003F17F64A
MSSELYSYLYEKALAEGALDIYTESIFMKKNRPAYKVTIICNEEDIDKFTELLLVETSTFGVRYQKFNRSTLYRRFSKINTKYGDIQIKLGYLNGKLIKVTPEYEDCKMMAKKENIPLNQIFNEINSIINEKFF